MNLCGGLGVRPEAGRASLRVPAGEEGQPHVAFSPGFDPRIAPPYAVGRFLTEGHLDCRG